MEGTAGHTGQQRDKNYDDTQAAQPVCNTPPEQNAARQRLQACDDRNPVGGHRRHSLKKRGEQVQLAGHPVGHPRQGRADDPGEGRRGNPFPVADRLCVFVKPGIMVQRIADEVTKQNTGKKDFRTSVLQVHGHSPGDNVNTPQT